jgi:hypothetical protein
MAREALGEVGEWRRNIAAEAGWARFASVKRALFDES